MRPRCLLHGQLYTAGGNVICAGRNIVEEFDLGADIGTAREPGVVDEGSSLAIRRKLAGGGIFKTLDDGGLAGAVVADDEGEGGKKAMLCRSKTPKDRTPRIDILSILDMVTDEVG